MTGLNHVATGAVIGLVVKEPALALPLAFLSHFVLDSLPHYGIVYAERHKYPSFRRVLGADSVLTPVFVLSLFLITGSWVVLGCMMLAIAPDFVWFIKFGHDKYKKRDFILPRDAFSKFHKKIQWGERPWAWRLDMIWFALALVVISRLI